MTDERLDTVPENEENTTQNENEERFVSDTQKIVRRHLENEDDVITEEDIRNVRVGMTPPLEETTEQSLSENGTDEAKDKRNPNDEDEIPGKQIVTPWDTLDSDE